MRIPLALLAVMLLAPSAAADEAEADCEPGQAFPLHPSYASTWSALGLGAVRPCEGEHWDGQDGVDPARACAAGDATCQGADPNEGGSDGPATGATARRSVRMDEGSREAYVSANVLLVARVSFYAGACDAGARGLEGNETCDADKSRAALYWRDNTPMNLACVAVSALGLTRSYCDERDPSHAEYECVVRGGCGRGIGRDDMAVTVETPLP